MFNALLNTILHIKGWPFNSHFKYNSKVAICASLRLAVEWFSYVNVVVISMTLQTCDMKDFTTKGSNYYTEIKYY